MFFFKYKTHTELPKHLLALFPETRILLFDVLGKTTLNFLKTILVFDFCLFEKLLSL